MKNHWFGNITVDNIKEIANEVLHRLDGKKYTFVSVYEYKRYEPETRVHQVLENGTNGSPLSVYFDENRKYAGFNICDTYGVW
jgi:hypothetical protein